MSNYVLVLDLGVESGCAAAGVRSSRALLKSFIINMIIVIVMFYYYYCYYYDHINNKGRASDPTPRKSVLIRPLVIS